MWQMEDSEKEIVHRNIGCKRKIQNFHIENAGLEVILKISSLK